VAVVIMHVHEYEIRI